MSSRGKKKRPIRELSYGIPGRDELFASMDELYGESDRAAALVASAGVQFLLEEAITTRFVALKDTEWNSMFRAENAPLSQFSTTIKIGYALGIYDDYIRDTLDTIRIIRNTFAHAARPISFEHETVIEECERLDPIRLRYWVKSEKIKSPARDRFVASCTMLQLLLLECRDNKKALKERDIRGADASIMIRPLPKKSE